MLRASVSLSRKISRDYNSTGYSVTLDGEVPFNPNDSEGVLEKVSELFHLAQEALAVEIDRDQGEDAIGRRDEEPKPPTNNGHAAPQSNSNSHGNGYSNNNGRSAPSPMSRSNYSNGNGSPDAATPKQLQFLQTIARRNKLNERQLEFRIGEVLGKNCGISQLTKKEAGLIIDNLTNGSVRTGG